MSNQIHTAVIKGPDFNRDELFKFGDEGIEKVLEIFNVFANDQIAKSSAEQFGIVGLRLAWNTRTQGGHPISRLDFAVAWTNLREQTFFRHAAAFQIRVDKALDDALAELAKQYAVSDEKP